MSLKGGSGTILNSVYKCRDNSDFHVLLLCKQFSHVDHRDCVAKAQVLVMGSKGCEVGMCLSS